MLLPPEPQPGDIWLGSRDVIIGIEDMRLLAVVVLDELGARRLAVDTLRTRTNFPCTLA